jgi:aspartyl protease family protein
MGRFAVTLEIGSQTGDEFRAVEALVDTGATYTVLPGSVLRELGIQAHRTSVFELADGTRREWQMGRAWVRLDGKQEMTLVVFGEEDVEPLLGAVTREEFLLAPDPVRKVLVPVPGLLMTLL